VLSEGAAKLQWRRAPTTVRRARPLAPSGCERDRSADPVCELCHEGGDLIADASVDQVEVLVEGVRREGTATT
jgi:hypothetical protein